MTSILSSSTLKKTDESGWRGRVVEREACSKINLLSFFLATFVSLEKKEKYLIKKDK